MNRKLLIAIISIILLFCGNIREAATSDDVESSSNLQSPVSSINANPTVALDTMPTDTQTYDKWLDKLKNGEPIRISGDIFDEVVKEFTNASSDCLHYANTYIIGNSLIKYELSLPHFTNPNNSEKQMNNFFIELFYKEIKEFTEIEEEYSSETIGYGYQTTTSYNSYSYFNKLVSFQISNSGYMGGIHGFDYSTWYTFNLETGKQASLTDLFTIPIDDIKLILSEKIYLTITNEESTFIELGNFNGVREHDIKETYEYCKDMLDDNKFFVTSKYFVIPFNTYDINCHAAGSQWIVIPIDSLGNAWVMR